MGKAKGMHQVYLQETSGFSKETDFCFTNLVEGRLFKESSYEAQAQHLKKRAAA
jgi:hypothetical protein